MNSVSPEVVVQWRAEFLAWLSDKHSIIAKFSGDELIIPARSGKSVRLVCGVALQAWMDSRQTACIELPEPLEFDDGHDEPSLHYWPTQLKNAIQAQGYSIGCKKATNNQ